MRRPRDWLRQAELDFQTVDEAAEHFQDRSPAYLPSRSPGVAVDVFVYTPAERAGWGERFAREVASGVALYRRA